MRTPTPTTPPHRIAFFGGAFDPPHRGHRAVLAWLSTLPQFDAVWIVPSFHHPFSKKMAPFEDRLAMCRLQFNQLENVSLSTIERDLSCSYTEPLFRKILSDHPDYHLTLVIGTDARRDLPTWKNGDALLRDFAILEIPRTGFTPSDASPEKTNTPLFPDCQSRNIRDMLNQPKKNNSHAHDLESALGKAVYDYIRTHDLYRGTPP